MNILEKINSLSLQEKVVLLTGFDGLSAIRMDAKDLHGIRMADGPYGIKTKTGESICYPNTCLMASSWDKELCYKIGEYLGDDCNRLNIDLILSPAINIKRNPLCGRNFEYYSEDAFLTGTLALEYVKGVKEKGVGVCAKHFACNSQEEDRWLYNSVVDEDTLRNVYLKAFEIVLNGAEVDSIMSAYNRLNGEYCCQNARIQKDILRDEWEYNGVVMSDWCAISDIVDSYKNGLDLEMPANPQITVPVLLEAVKKGVLTEKEIDVKLERLLTLYDRLKNRKNCKSTLEITDGEKENYLRKKTGESMVLLKNANALPLNPLDKVLVVGYGAVTPRIQGGGCAKMKTNYVVSPLEKMREYSNKIDYVDYSGLTSVDLDKYDKIVFFLSMTDECDSEAIDRRNLFFPKDQTTALSYVLEKHNKVVAVLQNGSSVVIEQEDKLSAILETYYAGSYGGGAVADVLYGKTNPCGKLTETFYNGLTQIPFDCTIKTGDVYYNEKELFGYRYFENQKEQPKYEFGFGLSYSDIMIETVEIDRREKYSFNVSCKLKNLSNIAGKQVVQVYLKSKNFNQNTYDLIAFENVDLNAFGEKKVDISLSGECFTRYIGGKKKFILGEYDICVGVSSKKIIKAQTFVFVESENIQYNQQTTLGKLLTDKKYREITLKYLQKAILEWAYGDNEQGLTVEDVESHPFLCSSIYNMPLRSFTYLPNGGFNLKVESEFIEKLNKML